MEAYTAAQLDDLEERQKALVRQQAEVKKSLVLKEQQLNQQLHLLRSRTEALRQREQAVGEWEAVLAAHAEQLQKIHERLVTFFRDRGEPLPDEAALEELAARLKSIRRELTRSASDRSEQSGREAANRAPAPEGPGAGGSAPESTPGRAQSPAPERASPLEADRPAGSLRWGNPVSVLMFPDEGSSEPVPSWVVARSGEELHLLADGPTALGTLLKVRPTETPFPFPGVQVQVIGCRREKGQWIVACRIMQKLSGAFLGLFG